MSHIEDNPKATAFVQNLADYLRFTLNCRDKEVVMLREELGMVDKYSYLQHSRFNSSLKILNQVEEKYWHFAVPPLSVQMLVENAIKHNIVSHDQPLIIKIYVENDDHLVVLNNLQKKNNVSSTGIGLQNIIERYSYLTRKEIIVETQEKYFKVAIPLLLVEF